MRWGWVGIFLLWASHAWAAPIGARPLGEERWFWAKSGGRYRAVHATLEAVGKRTYIYRENSLALPPDFLAKLSFNLEKKSPPTSLHPEMGLVPLEEFLFFPLPTYISADNRLQILLLSLPEHVNGYFDPMDQLSSEKAENRGGKSNEGNILYLNGLKTNEVAPTIAQELPALLTYPLSDDLWLESTLGKAAKLAAGYFDDQVYLQEFALNSALVPLVSHQYVQQGLQALFASFLLDSMPDKHKGLKFLATLNGNGRAAVETFFQENTGNPITFDAIFSKFLSYLFTDSAGGWLKERGQNFQGLKVPPIASYATFKSFPAQLDGELMPYSVVAVDLPQALPPTAIVELNAVPRGLPGSCGREATLLWKPINLTRIAVYSVGCEHHSLDDKIAFSLRVLDKPLPTAPSPRKITH